MTQQKNLSDSTSPVVSRGSSVVGQNKSLVVGRWSSVKTSHGSSVVGQSKSSVVDRQSLVYTDITHDMQKEYRITEAGTFVYYLKNRSGEMTFSLECPKARVFVFGIFEGDDNDSFTLKTVQSHIAPGAESHVLIKSVLRDSSRLNYSGNILIGKTAQHSIADLENRNLLIGNKASAETKPFLEILADDVQCRHSVATAPLSREHLAYLRNRGIPAQEAEELLVEGFLQDVEERIASAQKK